ncbi:arylsulfatase [Pseudomonas alkylphenolica]|uniref:Arylsulfatase A family protein n=1 Tax=Pseudomonas alkylphenolica TaxID=237609 RepID=A0A077FDT4_9PSED|nr:arylsulfatase [Pseudomonas alkylphenolica]AIL61436.1 arylsulfatase A family protein [Pseudomonas alkylphenolica]
MISYLKRLLAVPCLTCLALAAPLAHAQTARPNILVIWGDDIGWQNVSAYGMGTMGYSTPNIDSIGMQGIRFTDHYAQPSCTAGRAAFITGQYPIRSGMTTVGQPGDKLGLQAASPSLAQVLKSAGYNTGQFGKNHLGDNNPNLPTVHGFDEFFGNLYHLNTEEQHQYTDYQYYAKDYPGGPQAYAKKFQTRGVLHTFASDQDDTTVDPRFGPVGKQTIEDTGPLTMQRMEDFDGAEVIPKALDFMRKAHDQDKPFFVWLNTSRMHLYTHLNDKWRHAAAQYTHEDDTQGSGMLQHDHDIAQVLAFLKDQGLEDNTIVWYSTDNGPEHSSWPHGATTPFRGEKMTTYEGGVRVPSMLRWPGVIQPGQIKNGIQAHQDMFTTLATAAGVADVAERIRTEKKQYIDGINNLEYWTGKSPVSKRTSILYYIESKLTAVRMGPWKLHFSTKEDYYAQLVPRFAPLMFNLRSDPFESYDSKDSYGQLIQKSSWISGPMGELIGAHLKTLAEYPPVQQAKSFDRSNLVQDFLQSQKKTP